MKKSLFTIALFVLVGFSATAQLTTVLTFTGTNGSSPNGSLISDGTYLYGVAESGGANGKGNVFKVKPDGSGYVDLYDFSGTDGQSPVGTLYYDGTYLYGITFFGGTNSDGVIYKIMPNGSGFTKLLDFTNANGQYPTGALISDGTYLYGITLLGGANNMGLVYKIMPNGSNYTDILDFNGTNGAEPRTTLYYDGSTYLYGMTAQGGAYLSNCGGTGCGLIYKVKTDGSGYTDLYDFSSTGGTTPFSGPLVSDGTFFYGTTYASGGGGYGSIFKVMPDGSGFIDMLDFDNASKGGTVYSSLIYDGSTYLYGMTNTGGTSSDGLVYKIKTDGTGFIDMADFNGANGNGPVGNLISDGTFLYGMTNAGGTSSDGEVFKLCMSPPSISITSSATAICIGNTATLTANGAMSYTWSANASSAISASVAVNLTVTTTYTVMATDGNGCTANDTINLMVNPLPIITVNSATICMGNVAVLCAGGALTYTWAPASALSATTGSCVSANPITTTNYTVWGADANGCMSNVMDTVTVLNTPTLTVNSGTVCAGTSFTITPGGAVTYTYSSGNSIVTPTITSNYTVTGTDANGCVGSIMDTVMVNPLPVIISNSETVCIGDVVMLCANGALSYTWAPSSGLSATTGSCVTATPTISIGYTVTGTDANGCVVSATDIITVNSLPTITVNSGTICTGSNFTLTPNGAVTYSYSSGGAVVTPTTTSNYIVTGIDANGCMGSAIDTVTVNPLPTLTITASSYTICQGTTDTLTASGAASYTWSPGVHAVTQYTVHPNNSTTYTLTGVDANGCKNKLSQLITVNPRPTLTVTPTTQTICAGNSTTISTTTTLTLTYLWSTSATTPSITVSPALTTTYSVIGTDAAGCSHTRTCTVTVNACTGIEGYNNSDNISVYPNPNNGSFIIETGILYTNANCAIYDINGKLVLSLPINEKTIIDATNLNNGVYNLSISSNEGIINKRIVITR